MQDKNKTSADVFIDYDRPIYKGTIFEEILNFLQVIDTHNL